MRDDDRQLLRALAHLGQESGEFAVGVLEGTLTREAQLDFVRQLADIADAVHRRAKDTSAQVIEGTALAIRDD